MVDWLYSQLRNIPLYHSDDERPYGEMWIFILSFSGIASLTQLVLLFTSVTLDGVLVLLTYLIYLVFFMFCVTLMQIPIEAEELNPPEVVNQFDTSIQLSFSLFPVIYIVAYLIGYVALAGTTDGFRFVQIPIAAVQGLIFVGWLFAYSRPIQPTWLLENKNNPEFLQYYLEMWWRVIRAGTAIVLAIGIGLAVGIAMRVDYYSTNQLAYNILSVVPVGYPLGHYAFKKTKRVNTLIVQAS